MPPPVGCGRSRVKHRGVRRTVEDHIMGRMGLMGKHKAKKKDLSLEETPGGDWRDPRVLRESHNGLSSDLLCEKLF